MHALSEWALSQAVLVLEWVQPVQPMCSTLSRLTCTDEIDEINVRI